MPCVRSAVSLRQIQTAQTAPSPALLIETPGLVLFVMAMNYPY
jgi:hypothetical protein